MRRRGAIFVLLGGNRMSVPITQQRFHDITTTARQNIAWVVYSNVKPLTNHFMLWAFNTPM